ncbi:hypothetical protein EDB84DRAFT_1581490 [Lactarius hengduanensis]|nr:hypothetical protein EDB84DRAFT_1581490 [Lactarius hengduanensis]
MLKPIRHDTDSAPTLFSASTVDWDDILDEPPSYPVCNVAGHIHDNSAPTTFAPTILHYNAALVPSIVSLAASPLSVSSPPRLIESLADAQPLDNFHPTHLPTIESLRVPVSSPASATASAIQDTVNSGITTLHPTPETSISAPPLYPTSPLSLPSSKVQNPLCLPIHQTSHLQPCLIKFSVYFLQNPVTR